MKLNNFYRVATQNTDFLFGKIAVSLQSEVVEKKFGLFPIARSPGYVLELERRSHFFYGKTLYFHKGHIKHILCYDKPVSQSEVCAVALFDGGGQK